MRVLNQEAKVQYFRIEVDLRWCLCERRRKREEICYKMTQGGRGYVSPMATDKTGTSMLKVLNLYEMDSLTAVWPARHPASISQICGRWKIMHALFFLLLIPPLQIEWDLYYRSWARFLAWNLPQSSNAKLITSRSTRKSLAACWKSTPPYLLYAYPSTCLFRFVSSSNGYWSLIGLNDFTVEAQRDQTSSLSKEDSDIVRAFWMSTKWYF